MESELNTNNTIANLSKGAMAAFAIALLLSIYFLFTLPADLKFRGNVQHTELITPVLVRLYIVLSITVGLAILAIYSEMKKVKLAIVYKEKTNAQKEAEEKLQSESSNLENLDVTAMVSSKPSETLSNALKAIAKRIEAVAGACYICKEENGTRFAELVNGFALPLSDSDVIRFNFGDGMVGQVAKSGTSIYIDDIPESYFQVSSGLGHALPKYIAVLPLKKDGEVKGVIEIATFKSINNQLRPIIEKFASEIGGSLS